jgi:hypothetical protein
LVHTIIATEKSQDLPCASQRPKKAGGIIWPELESQRAWNE